MTASTTPLHGAVIGNGAAGHTSTPVPTVAADCGLSGTDRVRRGWPKVLTTAAAPVGERLGDKVVLAAGGQPPAGIHRVGFRGQVEAHHGIGGQPTDQRGFDR